MNTVGSIIAHLVKLFCKPVFHWLINIINFSKHFPRLFTVRLVSTKEIRSKKSSIFYLKIFVDKFINSSLIREETAVLDSVR